MPNIYLSVGTGVFSPKNGSFAMNDSLASITRVRNEFRLDNLRFMETSGDGHPVIVEVTSAWKPLSRPVMADLEGVLLSRFSIDKLSWRGFDPATEEWEDLYRQGEDEMTLRDIFAAKVISGLMSDTSILAQRGFRGELAVAAYETADAMIKERAK